jgi:hypothetical protein
MIGRLGRKGSLLAAVCGALAAAPLGVTAQTLPSPAPPPASSPAATAPAPLSLDPSSVGVVPGTTVLVRVLRGTAPFTVGGANASVDARYDAATNALVLAGRAPGQATLTVTDATGATASLAVLVAPAAGVVPGAISLALAGVVSPQFASERIAAAITHDAQVQTGAKLDVTGVTIPRALQPGDVVEADARVHIAGGGRFVDVDGTTAVHVEIVALDPLVAQFLFYSDDPEKVPDESGVLYRGVVEAARPARLYAYHVAEVAGMRLYLVLRPAAGTARIQVLGYAAGPTDAYGYAGHVATVQYLTERNTQESALVEASADAPHIRQLGYRPLEAGDLVTATFDLRVLAGGPVDVFLIAVTGDEDPVNYLGDQVLPGDGHGRTGIFSLASVPPLALSFTVGAAEPDPFVIGESGLPNLVPGGRALAGDYGVVRPVSLTLANPSAQPQPVYLYETPEGGSATTTIWFDGDPQPTSVGCVRVPTQRYLVKEFDLGPGESRAVTGSYMTDGASSFPLAFGLTATPPAAPPDPSAPGGCNSRV